MAQLSPWSRINEGTGTGMQTVSYQRDSDAIRKGEAKVDSHGVRDTSLKPQCNNARSEAASPHVYITYSRNLEVWGRVSVVPASIDSKADHERVIRESLAGLGFLLKFSLEMKFLWIWLSGSKILLRSTWELKQILPDAGILDEPVIVCVCVVNVVRDIHVLGGEHLSSVPFVKLRSWMPIELRYNTPDSIRGRNLTGLTRP